jgi:hypothetical protein
MSIMKFLRILLNESGMEGMYQFAPGERHVELVAAQSQVASLIAAYDALAPDWSQAPKDAQWCVIESTGDCYWHEAEPTPVGLSWKSGTADFAGFVFVIPLGIDWRLCKWQRPEVAA